MLPLLRRDDDDTRHSACTIDRGSRAVLQHLEALDVVGIETSDSRADERLRVPRSEVVGTYIRYVFHDDTVDDPEGLGAPVDRGCPTHADLRSCTKGPRDILYRDPCCAAFKGAGSIGHPVQLGLVTTELSGSPREEALVYLGEPRDDDLVQRLL